MPLTQDDRKNIRVETPDWKLYDKVAKGLTKERGYKHYINATIKIAVLEYVANHPELGVKA